MKEKYWSKFNSLLLKRELAGGELPMETEAELCQELTDIWWQLTEEEQEEVEQSIIDNDRCKAPKSLNLVDVDVEIGSSTFPRKNA